MADSVETRNQFIRQDSKYYDDDVDVEEDGGFESFQVLNGDGYENEDDDNSHSDENEGQFLGISESAASRQRTFAQLSQNIPEQELKQKASSVLDLINAEISDLHMRELELKKKNRAADGYENDSEDLIEEGSSQGDSDDYTDSAVDVESYSRSASNSSGNVTPADNRDKISQERDSPASPHGGTYHPAEVENKKEAGKLGIRQDSREDGKQQHLTSSAATSLMADDGDEEVLSSGTAVISANKQVGVKVRPIVEEEVKFIELSVEKETPIEKEIRLVREREDEFRRQRIASTPSVEGDDHSLSPSGPPKEKVVIQQRKEQEEKKVVPTGKNVNSSGHVSVANAKSVFEPSNGKDIQYEMATARLKREIEENYSRERELFQEGRLKSLSVPQPAAVEEVPTPDDTSSVADDESVSEEPEVEVQNDSGPEEQVDSVFSKEQGQDKVIPATQDQPKNASVGEGHRPLVRAPSTPVTRSNSSAGPQPNFHTSSGTPPPHSAPVVNSMRFFSPSGFSAASSPQSLSFQRGGSSFSGGSPQLSSLPFSKPQFTSIERMILKGSFTFNKSAIAEEPQRVQQIQEEVRMAKVSLMPDPLQIVQRTESIDETEEGEAVQEEIKPRRKYVPAQDKIQAELQEQVKREKELSQLRAKWKSTPDLSKTDDKMDEAEENSSADGDSVDGNGEGLTKPSALRRQMSTSTQKLSISEDVTTTDVLRMNKPTVRRRHSALINQWEEMIKQQQQKNNKN